MLRHSRRNPQAYGGSRKIGDNTPGLVAKGCWTTTGTVLEDVKGGFLFV
jgi:hypothetical protein